MKHPALHHRSPPCDAGILRQRDKQVGFTLIELLVTVSVAAILLSIAIPSFQSISIRNQLTTYANDFIASINYARSEAVHRGQAISICSSSNGTTCTGAWTAGWIIFKNSDNTVLRKHEGLAASYSLAGNAGVASTISYAADGSTSTTGALAVCYNNDKTKSRAIIVSRLRARVGTDTDGNGIANTDTGDIGSCTNP